MLSQYKAAWAVGMATNFMGGTCYAIGFEAANSCANGACSVGGGQNRAARRPHGFVTKKLQVIALHAILGVCSHVV